MLKPGIDPQEYYAKQNAILNKALPTCVMASLMPISISAIISCQDNIRLFNEKACQTPSIASNFDVCRTGAIQSYIDHYGNPYNNNNNTLTQ